MNTALAPALPAPAASVTLSRFRPPRVRDIAPPMVLIANANASGIGGRRDVVEGAAHLLRSSGARVEIRVTSSLDELESVVRGEERRLALLGGDGSLHAVANVEGPKPELALLPAGRANNVANALGVPTDLAAASALAAAGGTRSLDAIAVRTATRRQLAVEGVSVGFHAIARAGYHGTNSGDTLAGIKTGDRKSTRLNSSHANISYAVFC